jgi:hypothetical protein
MDEDPEIIRQQIAATRAALKDKLHRLDRQVRSSVHDARARVEDTVGIVRDGVGGAVELVKGSVGQHVPGVAVGGSFLAGIAIGIWSRRRPEASVETVVEIPQIVEQKETEAPTAPPDQCAYSEPTFGVFAPEVEKLRSIAWEALLDMVRYFLTHTLPRITPGLQEVANSVAEKARTRQ